MMITEKNTETLLEALAEHILNLKTIILLRDSEISRLKEKNAELSKALKEAEYGYKD